MATFPALPAHRAPTRRLIAWRPTTLREWPGRVATALYISGCGFQCPFCWSGPMIEPTQEPVDWVDVIRHLELRSDCIDGVAVTGGEPTDDPDLPSLLAALKEAGVAVKLDTNGANPQVLAMLIAEGLVDAVALDVKAVPARYAEVSGARDAASKVLECAEVLIGSSVEHEFRTTMFPGVVDLEDAPKIARWLRGGRLYVLQQYRPAATLDPAARSVEPYAPGSLRRAATACERFLPTIVRGLAPADD